MVNHIGVGTQAPESANLMRHMRVVGDRLIPDEPFSEPKEPSPGVQGTVLLVTAPSITPDEIFSFRAEI
ncbi:MAG: hypothetical protein U0R67_08930 [Micropruina glycogenica]